MSSERQSPPSSLPLPALRSVETPLTQSVTSHSEAGVGTVSVRAALSSGPVPVAVTYLPDSTCLSAIRSRPSLVVTSATRSLIPSSGVTWYGILPAYQSL